VQRLGSGERLIAVGAVALFAVSFLDWFGGRISTLRVNGVREPTGPYHVSGNAWSYSLPLVAVLLGVSMLVYVAFRAAGLDVPDSDTPGRVLAALGALAFVLVAIKLLVGANITLATFGIPDTSGLGAVQITITKTRDIGIYAGTVASAALAIGGYLTLRR